MLPCYRSTQRRFLYRILTGDEKWCLYIDVKQYRKWLGSVNKRHNAWNEIFICLKCYCAYSKTRKELSFTNYLNWTKRLILNSMFNGWNESTRLFQIKYQINRLKFFCCTTALTFLIRPRKSFKCLTGKCCHKIYTLPIWYIYIKSFDFHSFQSLSNTMRWILFNTNAALRVWLDQHFFSKNRIKKRWNKVTNNKGEYMTVCIYYCSIYLICYLFKLKNKPLKHFII